LAQLVRAIDTATERWLELAERAGWVNYSRN
jgi:hypothetical protein